MTFVASLFYPLVEFLNAYKWYFLIGILLYLVLTIIFRHSRTLITVVFGVLVLVFVITHLGGVYGTLNHLMTSVGNNTQIAAEEYADYLNDNIISDKDADIAEKVQRALNYGVLGREELGNEKLPDSSEMDLGETLDYVSNPNNDGNNEGAAKKALDGIVDFGIEIWNELVALFAE